MATCILAPPPSQVTTSQASVRSPSYRPLALALLSPQALSPFFGTHGSKGAYTHMHPYAHALLCTCIPMYMHPHALHHYTGASAPYLNSTCAVRFGRVSAPVSCGTLVTFVPSSLSTTTAYPSESPTRCFRPRWSSEGFSAFSSSVSSQTAPQSPSSLLVPLLSSAVRSC